MCIDFLAFLYIIPSLENKEEKDKKERNKVQDIEVKDEEIQEELKENKVPPHIKGNYKHSYISSY